MISRELAQRLTSAFPESADEIKKHVKEGKSKELMDLLLKSPDTRTKASEERKKRFALILLLS
ncbi:MAG: hypothetical protein CO140_00125 [Candidatus Moranbacteria bacterium CG_4_9_14_3_um_filter_40_7]|nr:MAG: hypothetical protein COX31_01730 [Candidatus Moranbacteria bacterium CG23_combo_of_CG06-09_8_20_14_all_40_16]PIU80836.1 MAG: hypothetical protein COS71_01285 [Candidatus Moranbacteria bacterium CG06_land_8_20_14_3_00_40_12]PJA88206.1 MAG: hypothetical protein CO140_00125 [Candidatus Moranbacteria bacterium CG_4_9_14_3_um_filter_40_7]